MVSTPVDNNVWVNRAFLVELVLIQLEFLWFMSIPIVFAVNVPIEKLNLEVHSKSVGNGTLMGTYIQ